MGGSETEKPKECHFTPKIFSPRNKGGENDMDNTFFLRGTRSAHFWEPPEFASGPPQANLQIPGCRLTKNLTANQFFLFLNFALELRASSLGEYTKNFSTLFSGLFSLCTTSKVWLLNDEPWPLCNFLHGFSSIV